MKTIILFTIILGMIANRIDAQVPKKVLSTFSLRYKNIENVKWVSNEGVYEASFEHMGQSKTAIFKNDGSWVKTNIYVAPEELTFCIKDFIKQEYLGAKVVKADLVRTPNTLKYFVAIESVNSNSLEDHKISEKTLIFNEQCSFLGEQER